jgi:integrase
MRLTENTLEKLVLPAGKTEAIYFDDDVPGFGLRLRESGSRTFIVQYSIGGRQRRMTLGTTAILKVAKARETAGNILAKVKLGRDPAAEREEARTRAADEPLGPVVSRFLAWQERRLRPRSYAEVKRHLEQHWKPLHSLQLTAITRATVATRLGKIAVEHGPISADRARASLSSFFTWAIGEGVCDMNPVIGTNKQFDDERSRTRVLSNDELKTIWPALPNSDYGSIIKLLILTGQRREEIGALRWSEVDLEDRVIYLGHTRTKNHCPHEIPLSRSAMAILKSHHTRAGRDLVFGDGPRNRGRDREAGFQGWSKSKASLDKKLSIVPWRVHDIRRTVATGMADLGVQPHVIEAVLNHVSGHKAGVAGVYNRSSYAAEKTAALELWGKHVQALVEADKPRDGQRIVRFPARAGK